MKRFALLALLASMSMSVVPAASQVDKKVEKELQASYAKLVAAIKKKDVKGVMAMMTPDATMKEMGQTMNRPQIEQMLSQQLPLMDLKTSTLKFTKLTAKNGTATGLYTETMHGNVKTPDGKVSRVDSVARYRAVFKKMGSEWKMKSSESLGAPQMKVDGKPVPVPVPNNVPSSGR